jgi:hypothetical protein
MGVKWKRFVQRKIKFGGRSEWNIEYRGVVVRYLTLRYFFWSGGGIGRHEGLKIPCH